jgi:uncharacterized integral membrane protein
VSETGEPGQGRSRTVQARRIVVAALVVYVVLFIVLNTDRVDISFVFFTIHTMLLIALALVAVLSFAAGFVVHGRRARR